VGVDPEEYDFHLYEGNKVSVTVFQIIEGDKPLVFTELAAGEYTIEAVYKNDMGCKSEPIHVTVGTDSQDPVLNETIKDNTFCTGSNGSIIIEVSAALGDDGSNGFDFTWHNGADENAPLSTYFTNIEQKV
jgi:hypothetical protein